MLCMFAMAFVALPIFDIQKFTPANFSLSIAHNSELASDVQTTILETYIYNFSPKLTLILPLILLAIYASNQQSQNKRLEEEYAHKANVAKTYMGHKRQLEALDDSEDKSSR